MPRKKVRYRIGLGGEGREIFSIGEGSTGDLSISLRGTDTLWMGDEIGRTGRPVEDRISIHRSLNSLLQGTTITRTVAFEDKTILKFSSFVKNSRKRFLWHVLSMTCPSLAISRYDPSTGETKKVIRLREETPKDSTLICHLFVANKGRDYPHKEAAMVNCVDYSNFRVLVYTNFVSIPLCHITAQVHIPTTTLKINGEKSSVNLEFYNQTYPGGAVNLEDSDIERLIQTLNSMLYDRLVPRIVDWISSGTSERKDDVIEILLRQKPYFSTYPLSVSKPVYVLDPLPGLWIPPKQEQP